MNRQPAGSTRREFGQRAGLLMLGLLAAGCGGPAPAKSGQSGGAVTGEIRMITPIFEGSDGAQVLSGLIADFTKQHPGVKVTPDYTTYAKLNEKLTTSLASGRPYDVMLMGVGWIPPFAAKGVLADLGDTPAALTAEYNDRVVQPGVYDGKVYARPIMLDTRFGYYRKDIFQQAGLDPEKPPATFAEIRDYARKLTVRGSDGKLTRAGIDILGIDIRQGFETLVWAAGGDLFTPDGKVAFNQPKAVSALQLMTDIIRTDKSEDLGFTEPGAATGVPIVQGRAAMMLGHNNTWQEFEQNAADLVKSGKIGFFVITGERPALFQGGTIGAVSAKSKVQPAAKEWVKYLASSGPSLAANQQRGNVPALKSLLSSEYVQKNPAVQFAMKNLGNAYSEGGIPAWLQIRGDFKATIESALLGKQSPQQALDDLAKKADAAIASGK
ncbi:ABC transporter substrate-binding protein [Kribbella sp. NPDC051952]|uniref:ABC transporter substrate-binding protein n=1 Tax=Kribbella sp. NPDC051952 TaxID=3154851 RepID=UPI00342CCA9E